MLRGLLAAPAVVAAGNLMPARSIERFFGPSIRYVNPLIGIDREILLGSDIYTDMLRACMQFGRSGGEARFLANKVAANLLSGRLERERFVLLNSFDGPTPRAPMPAPLVFRGIPIEIVA